MPTFEYLQHVHRPVAGVYSGAQPVGEAAFAELAALGVRTIISVDGARPDAEAVRAHGMQYVHLPIQYAGIDTQRRAELVAALRDCERPIYVHCHHGLHRGPAATAYALVGLGELSAEAGLRFLAEAGTSQDYPGLFACVREAGEAPPPAAANAIDGRALPEANFPGTIAQAMATIDQHWDNLQRTVEADWSTPAAHPDLVPAAEAGNLHDQFRSLESFDDGPIPLMQDIRWAGRIAEQLEAAIVAQDVKQRKLQFNAMEAACAQCHKRWRNK
ncbi:MAG: hypothetical protein KDA20_04665 [Phycisphaerales bacterium]|nr:hypothetical protein [Phycisphaerales bacterium]